MSTSGPILPAIARRSRGAAARSTVC